MGKMFIVRDSVFPWHEREALHRSVGDFGASLPAVTQRSAFDW